eukprot:7409588-Pyramimonas_sp.AAC.1
MPAYSACGAAFLARQPKAHDNTSCVYTTVRYTLSHALWGREVHAWRALCLLQQEDSCDIILPLMRHYAS